MCFIWSMRGLKLKVGAWENRGLKLKLGVGEIVGIWGGGGGEGGGCPTLGGPINFHTYSVGLFFLFAGATAPPRDNMALPLIVEVRKS